MSEAAADKVTRSLLDVTTPPVSFDGGGRTLDQEPEHAHDVPPLPTDASADDAHVEHEPPSSSRGPDAEVDDLVTGPVDGIVPGVTSSAASLFRAMSEQEKSDLAPG